MTEIRETVRQHYAEAARGAGCCSLEGDSSVFGASQYDEAATSVLPEEAIIASLGCGNPTALAALQPGETVLDLGSGGGIDVLLSARRVGPDGMAYGLDMTEEMLELARSNQAKAGATNVEFLKGHIEDIPLPDNSVDVIISNCVINLSPNKPAVFAEAFRVLRPGGRLAISDVVASTDLPDDIRDDLTLYSGCVAGASVVSQLEEMMAKVGFEDIRIAPKDESRTFIEQWAPGRNISDFVVSATIQATKPSGATSSCCG